MLSYLINKSDLQGGAALATYRIHQALRHANIESRILVDRSTSDDWTVTSPRSKIHKGWAIAKSSLTGKLIKPLFSTRNPRRIQKLDPDIVHLHWVAGEMLSIADIGRIHKPVVWTLHDMWAFCGAEHYTTDMRWRAGYRRDNRPSHESGLDLNRWTWERKRRHWQKPMHIVAPSRWLADCVRESALMRDWPVTVIPNAIDTDRWQPLDQGLARTLLGVPTDVPLLLFGAMGGGRDPRKGFDLLLEALSYLRGEVKDLHLVIFGQMEPKDPPDLGFPIHYTGHLHDDLSLRTLYSAADVMVLPSRQDNLPNTGVEAQTCGTPVVAFNTGGLPDIVEHRHTGYLARAFEPEDLAQGIRWVIEKGDEAGLRDNARARAVERFAYPTVAEQYQRVYASAIAEQGGDV